MRIARVLTRLNLGGPARQALALDPVLLDRGHEVRVFVGRPEPGEGDLFEAFLERGIDVRRVPELGRGPHPWRDLRARARLARGFAEFAPEVVHTHAAKAGALGRWAARRAGPGTALVHTFHGHVLEGYFPKLLSNRLVAIERRLAASTDRVLAVSEATAADLDRLGVIARDRLTVVPPGVELDGLARLPALDQGRCAEHAELRRRLGLGERDLLLLLLGRLAEVKRPELALQVFERLSSQRSDLFLAVVGDGALRAGLEALRAELPAALRSRVHLVGAEHDVLRWHAAADLLINTSRSEGLPVSLIEAAAAARPAVAFDVGGIGELLEDGRGGSLVDPDGGSAARIERFASAVAGWLDDPEGRARAGRAARAAALERHRPQALADRLERVYLEVASERRRLAG